MLPIGEPFNVKFGKKAC
jgi:hypothetical protein